MDFPFLYQLPVQKGMLSPMQFFANPYDLQFLVTVMIC